MTALSQLLRNGTRTEHEHAETRSFVTDLMSGALTREAYLDLARQHYTIYSHLEATAQRFANDEYVGPFVMPEVARMERIEADLHTLLGPEWIHDVAPLPATTVYAQRLDEITAPEEFLAHAYTRYLGDLSGGQAIAAMLRRHYGFTPEELTFYSFDVGKIKLFKDRYREMMDEVPFNEEQKQRAATEAQLTFRLNADVFVELGALHPVAALVG